MTKDQKMLTVALANIICLNSRSAGLAKLALSP